MSVESARIDASSAIKFTGNRLPRGAIHCTTIHAAVARAIWPKKTAFHWAAAANVKERMAKYWLAGKYPVSADGRLALKDLL